MTEEVVTKKILTWLIENNWTIVSCDFPQSGTGVMLHPDNKDDNTKNKNGIIPDIIAVKNNIAVFFENKNRFFLDDFIKINKLRNKNIYIHSINNLLIDYKIKEIYYGIGAIHNKKFMEQSKDYKNYVDFIVLVDKKIVIEKDNNNLF